MNAKRSFNHCCWKWQMWVLHGTPGEILFWTSLTRQLKSKTAVLKAALSARPPWRSVGCWLVQITTNFRNSDQRPLPPKQNRAPGEICWFLKKKSSRHIDGLQAQETQRPWNELPAQVHEKFTVAENGIKFFWIVCEISVWFHFVCIDFNQVSRGSKICSVMEEAHWAKWRWYIAVGLCSHPRVFMWRYWDFHEVCEKTLLQIGPRRKETWIWILFKKIAQNRQLLLCGNVRLRV